MNHNKHSKNKKDEHDFSKQYTPDFLRDVGHYGKEKPVVAPIGNMPKKELVNNVWVWVSVGILTIFIALAIGSVIFLAQFPQ